MPRIVVTRGLPEPALAALRDSGADVWVSEEDRALEPEELHSAVRGADAVVVRPSAAWPAGRACRT